MTDDLISVNVDNSALVEFIERVTVAGGSDIRVGQGDRGWYVTYRPPFTRDIKEDAESKHGDVCHAKSKQENDQAGNAKCSI